MLYVNPLDSGLAALGQPRPGTLAREKQALREFERLFLYMLLREMRQTAAVGSAREKTPAMRLYEDLLDDALSAEFARSGQVGIATQIERQLHPDRAQIAETTRALKHYAGIADND